MQTVDAARVRPEELDCVDEMVSGFAKDSHLAAALSNIVRTVRAGGDVLLASPDDWLTPSDAAQVVGISRTHLYKLMDAGRLPFKCLERDRRVLASDLWH